ncbi:hypothetical protein ACQ4PT_029464 [Festuca glaucescens]
MAGQVSKKELGIVLMQAMLAAKNIRTQRNRLLQIRRRLEHLSLGDKPGGRGQVQGHGSDLFKVYFIGIEAGARILTTCLKLAAQHVARLAVNLAFAAMPDEKLHDELVAQRLPACPTTPTKHSNHPAKTPRPTNDQRIRRPTNDQRKPTVTTNYQRKIHNDMTAETG